METTVAKFRSASGYEIWFEPGEVLPNNFIEAKQYMNSVFLSTGRFEHYVFNKDNVVDASQEESEMYQQIKDRSIHLIGKLYP